jgi:hypothetical protein
MPPTLFNRFCYFLGRFLFPKKQDWEQARATKTLILVLGFSLVLAVAVAKVIRMMYNHSK